MMKNVNGQLCAVATVAMLAGAAQANHLLTVDLSVTNQVTITATSNPSDVSATGSDGIGVYFEGFYDGAGNALIETLVSGDFSNAENPTDNTPNLFRGGSGSDVGLNVYSWSDDLNVNFTAGSTAFVGSGTWTLDAGAYADMTALGNRGGDLYFPADTADDIAGASRLGTYEVIVPAPGALAMMGLCLATRRNRR